jgi:hypothetical protein
LKAIERVIGYTEGNLSYTTNFPARDTSMASIPGEIADALVTVLQSAAVQAELSAAVTAGETDLIKVADNAINAASGTGILGVVIAAAKGTVETEFNAEIAKLPAAVIVAYVTALAVAEAKNLGG